MLLLLLFIHTVFTLTRVWQDLIPPPPPGEPAWWRSSPPATLHPRWQMKLQDRTEKKRKKRKEKNRYKRTAAAPRTWVSFCACSVPPFIWSGGSRLQEPPGSPPPLDRTLPCKAAQRPAHFGICLAHAVDIYILELTILKSPIKSNHLIIWIQAMKIQ